MSSEETIRGLLNDRCIKCWLWMFHPWHDNGDANMVHQQKIIDEYVNYNNSSERT